MEGFELMWQELTDVLEDHGSDAKMEFATGKTATRLGQAAGRKGKEDFVFFLDANQGSLLLIEGFWS